MIELRSLKTIIRVFMKFVKDSLSVILLQDLHVASRLLSTLVGFALRNLPSDT